MKKIVSLTLLCLLCSIAAVAQISVKKRTTQDGKSVAVLTVNSNLTAQNASLFNSKANEALNISRNILVNMENVEMMDETGITVLNTLNNNVGKVKGQMRICCLQPMVKLVFEVGGLDGVFAIYTGENEALNYSGWR